MSGQRCTGWPRVLTAAARRRRCPVPPAAFELLSRLPKHGLGSQLSRTSWTDDCFWTVSKVRLSSVSPAAELGAGLVCQACRLSGHCNCQLPLPSFACCSPLCLPACLLLTPTLFSNLQDGKHGSAWGTLTWRGQVQPPAAPTALHGPLKPVWRVVADSSSSSHGEPWQSTLTATLRAERQTAEAAAEAAAEGGAAAGEEPGAEGVAEQATASA